MKKRSFISSVLALSLGVSSLFTVGAAAVSMGDVDGNGEVTAADARLALRASVALETLTPEQTKAADVDFSETVTAADARLILRASVGLEILPEPEPEEILFNGHKVASDQIGIETGITCIDPECECGGSTLMPSFNDLVNVLKEPGSLNYFYGFSKTVTTTPKTECKANLVPVKNILDLEAQAENTNRKALAEILESFLANSVTPGVMTEYTDFTNRRHLNNATFFVKGAPYISDLKDSDIKSISTEKMTGVDFVKDLPNIYTSTLSKESYDLTKLKSSEIGEVYKVTITLNTETAANGNLPEEVTPIEKILNKDYNNGIRQQLESLDSELGGMPSDMEGLFVMEMSIVTTGVITYYFTADTYEPVAAKYSIGMNTDSYMHTYFANMLTFAKTEKATTTTTIKNNTVQENYFFFNDFFTVK